MSGSRMRTFSFDGSTLEDIQAWMQEGRGLDGIVPAIEALSGLAGDLENSMESLREALTADCADLTVAPAPTVLKLANVQHLSTPVEGKLAHN